MHERKREREEMHVRSLEDREKDMLFDAIVKRINRLLSSEWKFECFKVYDCVLIAVIKHVLTGRHWSGYVLVDDTLKMVKLSDVEVLKPNDVIDVLLENLERNDLHVIVPGKHIWNSSNEHNMCVLHKNEALENVLIESDLLAHDF